MDNSVGNFFSRLIIATGYCRPTGPPVLKTSSDFLMGAISFIMWVRVKCLAFAACERFTPAVRVSRRRFAFTSHVQQLRLWLF